MTTSLQKAAQDMLGAMTENSWLNSYEKLRMALGAEIAQETELVAWLRHDRFKAMTDDEKSSWIESGNSEVVEEYTIPLYLHPPQPQATTPVSTCGLDTDTLRDMAGAAFEEAMAFGVSTDSFERLARHVNKAATKAAKGEKP